MTQQGLLISPCPAQLFLKSLKKDILHSSFPRSTKAAVAGPENVCVGKSQERSIRQIPDRSAAGTHYVVTVSLFITSGSGRLCH